ncbi:hypothetical protein [Brachyspira pulli]|uniref:hypothetical protein n=1 Tax=Brachyspira pulli TaxID=310721 RepID=UPI003004F624
MQKQIKILLTLLTALILAVSCSKTPTNPTNDDSGNGSDVERTYTFIASEEMLAKPWSDQTKKDYFLNSWKGNFANQTIYKDTTFKTIGGKTDTKANYYEAANPDTVRTRFKFATNVTDNGKEYIGAVYYDETFIWGNQWRLIYIDENGSELGFWGNGENDPNKVPDSFTKYNNTVNPLGYIKIK